MFASTNIGFIAAKRPMTKKMLAIFEPIILPNAISLCPILAADIVPANSGKLVPTATTLKPIIISERPNAKAISTAESTVS